MAVKAKHHGTSQSFSAASGARKKDKYAQLISGRGRKSNADEERFSSMRAPREPRSRASVTSRQNRSVGSQGDRVRRRRPRALDAQEERGLPRMLVHASPPP